MPSIAVENVHCLIVINNSGGEYYYNSTSALGWRMHESKAQVFTSRADAECYVKEAKKRAIPSMRSLVTIREVV